MPAGSPRRTPLDRTRVVAEAVALADEQGLDAVSMRALAGRLGVVPMALYKHVADKDDLVAGMLDAVIDGYAAPPLGTDWRDTVRARILAARQALLVHPWLRPAIEGATRRTPSVLRHMDTLAGDLIDAGFSVDLTHHAMHALGHRIWGFSPEAFSSPAAGGEEAPPPPEVMQQLAQAFPYVTAIALDAATRNPTGACDEQSEFEFTLDLLLDAFERLHAAGWSSVQT
ncbi:MAG: TetR/AcrR family transcriptional regulator C-terminal domain-containing protein [Candidatus Nanopelagicales bacterium]